MRRRRGALRHVTGLCVAAGVGLALVGGCGGRTGDLGGKVTYQDKHLRQGTVSVFAADGSIHNAVIQDDGRYAVPGVPVGEAKVGVSSPDPRSVKVAQRKKDEKAPPADTSRWFAIPDRYTDARQSGLTTTIKSGPNTFDIELK